jgi:pimeloyl-ACP methyl ester carboxylesterase
VLVHGLGGGASNWLALAPVLAAERRVIVPELPGHGGTAPLPAAPTVDPFADAVLAVLEAEDALPAPWVGHSLGGLVGLRAAMRRPEAVTGLATGRRGQGQRSAAPSRSARGGSPTRRASIPRSRKRSSPAPPSTRTRFPPGGR